tara:strand:+ start:137 stop:502 length:366 start_codon:yes stop_codon:yes gene_type:complete
MPKNNPIPTPLFFAEAAIAANIATVLGLKKIMDLLAEGNTEGAFEGFRLTMNMAQETDAGLRAIRDICQNLEPLPYFYTPSHRCECGAPLRFPLVWNQVSKTTGEYICSHEVAEFEQCSAK